MVLSRIADAAPPANPAKSSLDADQLSPGLFTGIVVSTPKADRKITINVSYQKIQLKAGQNLAQANQSLQRQYNRILQLQNQLMRPPSRGHNLANTMQQLQNALVQFQTQLARTQANLFEVVNATQKVDFQMEESVKVRIKDLPEPFDEKGNIKKYTREELAALKGKDKDLPGYESALDKLKAGQMVLVKLSPHKRPRPATRCFLQRGQRRTRPEAQGQGRVSRAQATTTTDSGSQGQRIAAGFDQLGEEQEKQVRSQQAASVREQRRPPLPDGRGSASPLVLCQRRLHARSSSKIELILFSTSSG